MKTTYIGALAALAVCGSLTACDENSWNDHLDGFEEITDGPIQNTEAIEYTLTDADYSAIASNSTNVALAGEANSAALKAVGTLHRFSPVITAKDYVPAFLESTAFPYFTLSDGSSVRLTYRTAEAEPADFTEAQTVRTYSISNEQYELDIWGSEDYIDAFAPSMNPADYIPGILEEFADADAAKYYVVSYKMATQEPVFGGSQQPEQPAGPVEVFAESFTESLGDFTIEDTALPEALTYVWSWGGANYGAKASAFANGTSYASDSWLISPVINLKGNVDPVLTFEHVYNKFPDLEFALANCTLNVREEGASAWTKVAIPVTTDNTSWTFCSSGDIDLSAYAGKKIQLGFHYVSEEGKSGTWEVKNLVLKATPASAKAPARVKAEVPVQTVNAVYHFDGSKWAPATGFAVLNPSDYTEMGQKYANLTTAEPYLSTYLGVKYPYAAEGTVMYVYWLRYASGATAYACSAYVRTAEGWTPDDFTVEETNQFVRSGGKWMYDPNVEITLPAGRNQEVSTRYFQACVDWVFNSICKPLGDTSITSGLFYVTKYGNNEYYSGASAYQGNVDLRASAARGQYPAGYEGLTDDQVVELLKKRFICEVFPAALAQLHPEAKPVEGLTVHYTIHFSAYDGSATTAYDVVYDVTGAAQFTPLSCTWWADGKIPE